MRIISQKCAAVLLVVFCLLGNRSALAADWVPVGGNVRSGETPICALVLINGQTQFSCDGTGRYDMQVPVDDNGMITVMVFADGFAPFNQIVTPEQAAVFPVDILLDQNSPTFEVVPTYEPSAIEGRFIVSGTINYGAIPVCALALANGVSMFSCNENQGLFSLDVPLDQDGNITLMVFAAGFKPFKVTASVLDSDDDGIRNDLDYDDDNDGILDEDDGCPSNPVNPCKEITVADTVTVQGRVWAQPLLFSGYSAVTWDDINDVCPSGVCGKNATLSGWDIGGWTWASTADLINLFNIYLAPDLELKLIDFGGEKRQEENRNVELDDPHAHFDNFFDRDGWRGGYAPVYPPYITNPVYVSRFVGGFIYDRRVKTKSDFMAYADVNQCIAIDRTYCPQIRSGFYAYSELSPRGFPNSGVWLYH